MKFIYTLIINSVFLVLSYGQTVSNGTFGAGATNWGCNPEINVDLVYGGSSATNNVAEVDAAVGLCQTITGFTIGSLYNLSFLCSRRTSCGPSLQTMDVTLSNGALSTSVSRNGTPFAFTTESKSFFATATSLTLTFTGTTTETCNLIVDNIQITLVSALPVELSKFSVDCSEDKAIAQWTTESENRSDYFTLQSSSDAINWKDVSVVKAQQHSASKSNYTAEDNDISGGLSYYRLQLTNTDGGTEIIGTALLDCPGTGMELYPNPSTGIFHIRSPIENFKGVYDASGRFVTVPVFETGNSELQLDLSAFSPGIYYLNIAGTNHRIIKN